MNAAEGFFGVGAIIGPAILVRLLAAGVSWKWLYGIAGVICVVLIVLALLVRYPEASRPAGGSGFSGTGRALKNPYVLAFSTGAFLYVGVEAAIYVWMPTLLQSYGGVATRTAAYSISVFFILRAAGRFLGAWMLTRVQWQAVLALFSGGILLCFVVSMAGGVELGGLPAAALRTLHVGDLSDDQLEGDQLPAEGRARRRGGRDPVFHVRVGGPGAAGDRRRERRVRARSSTGSGSRPASRRCCFSARS